MANQYMVVDILTSPNNPEQFFEMPEDERGELLNPIDSRIICAGIRFNEKNFVFTDENERILLKKFWDVWKDITDKDRFTKIVGFNILSFDMPFITTRSFANEVNIVPFTLKNVIDLRDKVSAYKYGPRRGRLKEFGEMMGLETVDYEGEEVVKLWQEKNHSILYEIVENHLYITGEMYKRALKTRVVDISKF